MFSAGGFRPSQIFCCTSSLNHKTLCVSASVRAIILLWVRSITCLVQIHIFYHIDATKDNQNAAEHIA